MAKGRPPKYPISHLNVGESTLLPWVRDELGRATNAQLIYNSIAQHGRLHFKAFQTTQTPDGMMVLRVK